MRRALLALLLLSFAACGDSDSTSTAEYPLAGFWGGYFPGSSLENPTAGVEIHFERHGRNGFIHREGGTAHRAAVSLERDGNAVTLAFDSASGDHSTFKGRFVDADTIRGRFTNPQRGESFPLELVRAESVGLTPPTTPAPSAMPPALAAQTTALPPHLTLQIEAQTESGATYTFLFGFGWYYTPGTWVSSDTIPGGPVPESGPATGPSAVLQLLFFPGWIVFDAYTYDSQILLSASFEVSIDEFIKTNVGAPQTIEPFDTSFVGVWWDDEPATFVTFSFVETEAWYDRPGWPTRTTDPKNQIFYDGTEYILPSNMADMLIGFVGLS